MFTRDDLIDLIVSHLRPHDGARVAPLKEKCYPDSMLPKGRIFLSEHEIKKRLTGSAQHLTIPKEAIISPLALDWLVLRGVKIIRE